jgi:hypothetical protein
MFDRLGRLNGPNAIIGPFPDGGLRRSCIFRPGAELKSSFVFLIAGSYVPAEPLDSQQLHSPRIGAHR